MSLSFSLTLRRRGIERHPSSLAQLAELVDQPLGQNEPVNMAELKAVVLDCAAPSALARFWSAALDEFEIRPYDAAEIARLAALGFTPETDPAVILDGPHLELCFQQTDLETRSKKPMHLDIAATDLDAEIQRLLSLGATVKKRFEDHAWMLDPEQNDFCVFQAN